MSKGFMEIWLEVTNAEIAEKIEILHIERGIQYQAFITESIVEKLRRDGYLKDGVHEHILEQKKESDIEQLRNSLMKIQLRRK